VAKVRVLATGGTPSYTGADRLDMVTYAETGRQLPIDEVVGRIPELQLIAAVDAEQLYAEDYRSFALGSNEWPDLARHCTSLFRDEGFDGIVITHGSAVAEETAYFLNLTVRDARPIVVTTAIRPITALGTDAEINLVDAVRVAASSEARGKGTLLVVNSEIHGAREATKSNTSRVEAFQPRELGYLGYADSDGSVQFYRTTTRRHTLASEFDIDRLLELPRVEILYSYGGARRDLVDAVVEIGVEGIVMAGPGAAFPLEVQAALESARSAGIAVVFSSRIANGRIMLGPSRRSQGYISADNLSPQKARILLSLALTLTKDPQRIQQFFDMY